jgi:Fe-S-cluster containining protein
MTFAVAALDLSGGQFRCTVYQDRPLICRAYKFHGAQSVCPPVEEPIDIG